MTSERRPALRDRARGRGRSGRARNPVGVAGRASLPRGRARMGARRARAARVVVAPLNRQPTLPRRLGDRSGHAAHPGRGRRLGRRPRARLGPGSAPAAARGVAPGAAARGGDRHGDRTRGDPGQMRWRSGWLILAMVALASVPATSRAQSGAPPASQRQINILEHLGNSHRIELPYWKPPYSYPLELPRFAPVHVSGLTLDFSITKHLVFMILAATIAALVLSYTAYAVARAQGAGRPPRGFAAAMEAIVLYVRQEVILPNVGPHGEGYVNYLLSVFFFLLACNLFGLLPWGATATSNIAVTGAMALLSLCVIEISGMRALGLKGYLRTIFYLPPGLPTWIRPIMLVIMTPIEIIGT